MGLLQHLREIARSGEYYQIPPSSAPTQVDAQVEATKPQEKKETTFPLTVVLGDWRLGDSVKRGGVYNPEDFETVQIMKTALMNMDGAEKYSVRYLDNHITLERDLKQTHTSLVLNLCDEGYMNNALLELHVPSLLEMLHVPYTGAGPTCLGMCYDKSLVRALAVSVNVPVPDEICVNRLMGEKVPKLQSFPRFIKPALGDNSIGITPGSLVHTQEEAEAYVEQLYARFPDRPSLIQEYLEGTEYSVGLIGNPKAGFTWMPIMQVDYSQLDPSLPPILGYESKFEPDSPYFTEINYKQANSLDKEQEAALYKCAERLFERCMCRDYARFDFRMDNKGVVKLLEVNPNPGWCWDGKFNKMAGFKGWNYSQLLAAILDAARQRLMLV